MSAYRFRGVELPNDIRESLDAYAQTGRPTGDFLRACLANDLMGAFGRADDESLAAIPAICGYIYNVLPSQCHGSPHYVKAWIEKHAAERAAR